METNFPKISIEQWHARLQKDLKGESLQSFEWNLGELRVSPFVHKDIVPLTNKPLERQQTISSKVPAICISSPLTAKKEIENGLAQGIGTFFLDRGLVTQKHNLLEGIHLDLVDILWSDNRFGCSFHNHDLVISELTDCLNQWITQSEDSIKIILGHSFYVNVCGMRALRLCLDQIQKDLGLPIPTLLGSYQYDSQKDQAQNLLESMSIFTAALIGGADCLTEEGSPDPETHRLLMNNIHLLLMESQIPLDEDVVSGAYYFEEMTADLAERVWNNLLKSKGQNE